MSKNPGKSVLTRRELEAACLIDEKAEIDSLLEALADALGEAA